MRNLLFTVFTALLVTGCSLSETQVFLVPAHYQGRVRVVLGQDNVAANPTAGDSVYYNIPKDGILLSAEGVPVDMTLVSQKFYSEDEDGKREELQVNPPDGAFGVYLFSITHEEESAFSNLAYYEFFVCTAAEVAKYASDEMTQNYNQRMREKMGETD